MLNSKTYRYYNDILMITRIMFFTKKKELCIYTHITYTYIIENNYSIIFTYVFKHINWKTNINIQIIIII